MELGEGLVGMVVRRQVLADPGGHVPDRLNEHTDTIAEILRNVKLALVAKFVVFCQKSSTFYCVLLRKNGFWQVVTG